MSNHTLQWVAAAMREDGTIDVSDALTLAVEVQKSADDDIQRLTASRNRRTLIAFLGGAAFLGVGAMLIGYVDLPERGDFAIELAVLAAAALMGFKCGGATGAAAAIAAVQAGNGRRLPQINQPPSDDYKARPRPGAGQGSSEQHAGDAG